QTRAPISQTIARRHPLPSHCVAVVTVLLLPRRPISFVAQRASFAKFCGRESQPFWAQRALPLPSPTLLGRPLPLGTGPSRGNGLFPRKAILYGSHLGGPQNAHAAPIPGRRMARRGSLRPHPHPIQQAEDDVGKTKAENARPKAPSHAALGEQRAQRRDD